MNKSLFITLFLILSGNITCYSQNLIDDLGKKVVDKVKNKTEEKIDNTIDNAFDNNKNKKQNNNDLSAESTVEQYDEQIDKSTKQNNDKQKNTPEIQYKSFDFVAGDEIIFDDNLIGEKTGEFPSRWDLLEGECEIAGFNGQNVICLKSGIEIRPLITNNNYLSDEFTVEFDYYFTLEKENERHGSYDLYLIPATETLHGYNKFHIELPGFLNEWYYNREEEETKKVNYRYEWFTPTDELREGQRLLFIEPDNWIHLSLSFNKRAMKIYVNETRIGNIPNMSNDIGWIDITYNNADEGRNGYIKNFRIAKGAVPIYDRMMTDGKIITYGITFDVGKSTIKPESMGEINRIFTLMNEKPELNFLVEGHTDNTGNAENNQTLSEARSKAIVNKLVEMGISPKRLTSYGKGQNNPIADNNTNEGRAKNRRVEFIKQ